MKRIITSQDFLNEEIVEEYVEKIENGEIESITLNCWETNLTDDDGNELFVLSNCHHRFAASKIADKKIEIEFNYCRHPEGIDGDNLLEQAYNDSDYRYIDDNKFVF